MEGLPASDSFSRPALEKKGKPKEQLNCPRCNSTNTKFCYYNNYSLTQPRYFCKSCRRYWTEGGSLRNVPVGGGSRKNKKAIPTATSSPSSSLKILDLNPVPSLQAHIQNPKSSHAGQDPNLAIFPALESYNHGIPYYVHEVPKLENSSSVHYHHENSCSTSSSFSALELLRSGMAYRGLSSYIPTLMPESDTIYDSGLFPPQVLKTTLDFSSYAVPENNGRRVFPLAEMKNLSASNDVQQQQQHKEQPNSIGYNWNGVMGEGSW